MDTVARKGSMDRDGALRELEGVADELARTGNVRLADRTRAAVAALRNGSAPPDSIRRRREAGHSDPAVSHDLVELAEAAKLLGVRSKLMVLRWAREGILDGAKVDGRVRIARSSVERMQNSAPVEWQRERERELAEILDASEGGDELPPSDASSRGRAPWDDVGSRRS